MAFVVGSSLPSGTARASDDPASLEAKRHYEEGTKAFNLGEYPRAIAEFKATYNAKPDPLLLYNIAQSYRLAGDAGQALFFYKSFLRNMPAAENRKEVEGQIHKLEKQVADQKKDPTSAPPPVVVPAPTPTPVTVVPPVAVAPTAPGAGTTTVPPPAANPPAVSAPPEASKRDVAPPLMTAPPPPLGSPTQVDLTAPAPTPTPTSRDEAEDRPFYKKWWFWVGTAGAVILVGGIAAANARKPPSTSLGLYDPTFL